MNDKTYTWLEPAFKGSMFMSWEYQDVWGDDWHTLFMPKANDSEETLRELLHN